MSNVLENLAQVLEARKEADPETSYVASLHAKGLNKILEKVGEECTETLLAAKDAEHSGETRDVVYETTGQVTGNTPNGGFREPVLVTYNSMERKH